MEADGARFLWLDEYRHHEIFEGFGSPQEPGRWSATLVGTLSDLPNQQSLAIPAGTRGHRRRASFAPVPHDQNWGRVRPE